MSKTRNSTTTTRWTNSNVRAKAAPASVTAPKEALEALQRQRQYRELAHSAYRKAAQTAGGTATSQMAYERYEKYADIADAWEAALEAWLTAQLMAHGAFAKCS